MASKAEEIMDGKKPKRTITVSKITRRNPVKKNMEKFNRPATHRDRTKYTRKGKPQ
tara:strand:- start:297 stop:464 length:168 start_codon:yes stop_codon:yes gene_type:complete